MVNENIVARFKNDGDIIWANCLDVVDCIIIDAEDKDYRIGQDDQKSVRENFKNVEADEEILFIRDLTFFNTRCQGCIITDKALYFMLEKNKPEKAFALTWADIKSIQIEDKKFCIIMQDSSKHYIDTNLLLKKKDPSEKMLKRIAKFLNEIAASELSTQLDSDGLKESNNEVYDHMPQPKKNAGEYLSDMCKLVTGVTALQNRKAANEKKEKAEKIMEETTRQIEQVRFLAHTRLETFGRVRCEILKTTVGRFIKIVESLNNTVKEKVYELSSSLSLGETDFKELESVEMNGSNLLATATTGGSIAAAALAGVPAAVNASVAALCSASTGTAISQLSGAAARQATLAWLGGGSVAAGGGGVAAGATVLAGITWAATGIMTLASVGIVAGKIYSQKHTDAEKYLADVETWQAKSLAASEIMKGVVMRSDELLSVTSRLEGRIIPALDELDAIVPIFSPVNPEHAKTFQRAAILVKSMSELAQTPLLDEKGNLNKQSLIMVDKTQKILNHQLA